MDLVGPGTLGGEAAAPSLGEGVEDVVHLREHTRVHVGGRSRHGEMPRHRRGVDQVAHGQAERRERRSVRRHDDAPHPERPSDVDAMEAARTAEREEGEVPRVRAALDRADPDGVGHDVIDDLVDPRRRLLQAEPELGREPPDGVARELRSQLHPTRREVLGRDVAEDDVGVGDGGMLAASAVRSGPRHGSRRSGTDAQRAAHPRCRNAPAPRRDRMDVDQGHRYRHPVERLARRRRELAVLDDRHVGARPTHVERDEVRLADPRREVACPDEPCSRPGELEVDGARDRSLDGRDAAVGAHDHGSPGEPRRTEVRLQRPR